MELSALLSNPGTDLLSRMARQMHSMDVWPLFRLSWMAQRFLHFGNLHDAIQDAVNQSMRAATGTIAWISEPTTDNQASAIERFG